MCFQNKLFKTIFCTVNVSNFKASVLFFPLMLIFRNWCKRVVPDQIQVSLDQCGPSLIWEQLLQLLAMFQVGDFPCRPMLLTTELPNPLSCACVQGIYLNNQLLGSMCSFVMEPGHQSRGANKSRLAKLKVMLGIGLSSSYICFIFKHMYEENKLIHIYEEDKPSPSPS